jgi:AcrR family transcriptional regulator
VQGKFSPVIAAALNGRARTFVLIMWVMAARTSARASVAPARSTPRTAPASANPKPTTRTAILHRAVDLASREGLEGLTIGRLAAELKMSKSGLFRHFGSKEELQLATVEAASQVFVREVIEPVLDRPEGAERLAAYCDSFLSYMERRVFEGGCFFAAASSEFDGRPGAVREAIRAAMTAWLAELARQAELAGVDDPHQLAFEIHALAQQANWAHELLEDPRACERARRAIAARLPDPSPITTETRTDA